MGDCERELGRNQEALELYTKAYEVSGNKIYLKEKEKLQGNLPGKKEEAPKKKKFLGLF